MGLNERPIRILGLILLVLAGTALSGCSSALPQTPFDPAGPVSQMQFDLLKLTLWFAIVIGVIVSAVLLYVVYRFRDTNPSSRSVPAQIQGDHKLEILWTIIPIAILVIVAIPTVRAAFATHESADPNAMAVRVVAHQWWFEFEYPDAKVTTANELYIPVGRDIQISLESDDVIHSFWVPKLAGKVDLIPGRVNTMWFRADTADTYFGQCAEFCGTSHAQMRFRVVAVPQEEFDAWLQKQQAGEPDVPTDPVAKLGYELFMGATPSKANCLTCHAIDGTKAQGKIGPNLTNIGDRKTLAAGVHENTEEHLRQWLRKPASLKPGVTVMPSHPNLTEEELTAIVTYLQSLGR